MNSKVKGKSIRRIRANADSPEKAARKKALEFYDKVRFLKTVYPLVRRYGFELAGFIDFLLGHQTYLICAGEISPGDWFWIDCKKIEEMIGYNYDQQKLILDKIVKLFFKVDEHGNKVYLFEKKRKGIPPKIHLKLNLHVLYELTSETLIIDLKKKKQKDDIKEKESIEVETDVSG